MALHHFTRVSVFIAYDLGPKKQQSSVKCYPFCEGFDDFSYSDVLCLGSHDVNSDLTILFGWLQTINFLGHLNSPWCDNHTSE